MARLKFFDIGTSQPIVIEKWTQGKKASGSLGDVFEQSYTAYANVDNISSLRVFENGGLKQAETFEMIVRKKVLDARDVNVKWKVKYQGKRHAIKDKVCINKRNSDFLLVVETKGDTIQVSTPANQLDSGVKSDYWNTTAGQNYISGTSAVKGYSLINKTILIVMREGIQYNVVSGTPGNKECTYDSSTGKITFATNFNSNETVFVEFK